MRDRITFGLKALGVLAMAAGLFVPVALGLHEALQGDTPKSSAGTGAVSFEGATQVGEIEGRKLYRFDLDDGTRCLAISGYNGSGLDCDWATPAINTEN